MNYDVAFESSLYGALPAQQRWSLNPFHLMEGMDAIESQWKCLSLTEKELLPVKVDEWGAFGYRQEEEQQKVW